jgi:hypothetical protein
MINEELELRVQMTFPATLISEQFPLNTEASNSIGIVVCAQSNVVYCDKNKTDDEVEELLERTNIHESGQDSDNRHYYRQQLSNANLTYNPYANGQSVGTSGDFAQLGINASDPDRNYPIYTNGYYDASDVAESKLQEAKYIQYEFTLYRKSDNADGSISYVDVGDINNYISEIVFSENQFAEEVSSEKEGAYVFDWEPKDADYTKNIQIRFEVLTGDRKFGDSGADGSAFESAGQFYANYRLELKATLLDENMNPISDTEATDSIIYTNARLKYDFIDGTN